MPSRCILIAVEGNHDQAFIERVLRKLLGFSPWNRKSELEKLWEDFIPEYNPKITKEYYRRLSMPSILSKDDISVAIYVGEGSNLLENISDIFADSDLQLFSGFGIVLDADKTSPTKIAKTYCDRLKKYFPEFPEKAGTVAKGSTNLGVYILPNNSEQGVLDTLLCECGELAYPLYMERAKNYINQFSEVNWKGFDKYKATIAAVASVLKPGKTNTASITNDKWISLDTAAQIPAIQDLRNFLSDLISS